MVRRMILVGVALIWLAGCGHVSGGIAPSTIPLEPGSYRVLNDVQGRDCLYYLLSILPLSGGNETRRAVSAALRKEPDAIALINVTSDTFQQQFILFNRTCTEVHGTAVAPK
ncbi:MAG: hypothetical protein JSU66_12930 [Deltaproteobacteria bacterium]|nr:MAG: hypothetical protein JSU66_12930 [Deltaproteobacteria bacterium]